MIDPLQILAVVASSRQLFFPGQSRLMELSFKGSGAIKCLG